jgi:hypothetical protein
MAMHSINFDHHIQFLDPNILSKKFRHTECISREATEIELCPCEMNREEGISLNKSWKPLVQTLRE